MDQKETKKRLGLLLDPDEITKLKVESAKAGKSMSRFVMWLLDRYKEGK